jgi:protein transport protein SEC13
VYVVILVNSLSWAPHTQGLLLAAGAADGTVSIYEYKGAHQCRLTVFEHIVYVHVYGYVCLCHIVDNNTWERKVIAAHKGACTAVSWGPDMKTGSLLSAAADAKSAAPTSTVPTATGGAAATSGAGTSATLAEVKAVATKRFVTSGCDNRIRIWRYFTMPLPYLPIHYLIIRCYRHHAIVIWRMKVNGLNKREFGQVVI